MIFNSIAHRVLILFFAALLFLGKQSTAQCSAPTAIAAPSITNASCPGNGIVVTGTITPAAGTSNYYQYQLTDTSSQSTTVFKPWQDSATFVNVDAGHYDIQVRTVCGGSFSSILKRRVVVGSTYTGANISNITVNRTAQTCCDGRFTVTAVGSAPLQYALVNSQTALDVPSNLVRPRQNANVFDSVCAGTYYVRVYDACGGYATQAVTVGTYTTVASYDNIYTVRYGCDSFGLSYNIVNMRRIANTRDTATVRFWVEWPSGIVDTVALGNSSNAALNGVVSPFSYNRLGVQDYPGLRFPANYNWPKVANFYYRDACGNVTSRTYSINRPGALTLLLSNTAHPTQQCDSVNYNFQVHHAGVVMGTSRSLFNNSVLFSLDSGASWQPATSSVNPSVASRWFGVARGRSTRLLVAYCGDTLGTTITLARPVDIGLSQNIGSLNNAGCTWAARFVVPSNAESPVLSVQILSAPPALSPVPAGVTVSAANATVVYGSLPYGTYTFRIIDSMACGVRFVDRTMTVNQDALNVTMTRANSNSCTGFVGLAVRSTNRLGTMLSVEMKAAPVGVSLVPAFNASVPNINNWYLPTQLNNLLPGNYTFTIADSLGAAATCPRVQTVNVTIPEGTTVNPSVSEISRACNGALTFRVNNAEFPAVLTTAKFWGAALKFQVINNASAVVYEGDGVLADGTSTSFTIPAGVISGMPDGAYTMRTSLNYAPGCTTRDTVFIKEQFPTISLTPSRFIGGCNGNSTSATLVAIPLGGTPPFTYSLFRNSLLLDSLIAGPQSNPIFNNLNANTKYVIQASDQCGYGTNMEMSVSESFVTHTVNTTLMPCLGDSLAIEITAMPGTTNQWYRNRAIIPAATGSTIVVNPIVAADSGDYYVAVTIGSCIATSREFMLNPHNCNVPLSVRMGNLSGRMYQNQAVLSWTTYQERDNSGFEVERSADAARWERIGFVASLAGHHSSDREIGYQYYDRQAGGAAYHYRLKQVNSDGTYAFSNTIRLGAGAEAGKITVYPNPSNGSFTLAGAETGQTILVTDITGKVVFTTIASARLQYLQLGDLVAGSYHVLVRTGEGTVIAAKMNIVK